MSAARELLDGGYTDYYSYTERRFLAIIIIIVRHIILNFENDDKSLEKFNNLL